ncbi:MAG: phosphodiester glycosidase family protein [Candidatus Sericytochromatia bacterium]
MQKGISSRFLAPVVIALAAVWAGEAQAAERPVSYSSFRDSDQGQGIRVHMVEVNLKDPRVSVDIAMAKNQASTKERTAEIAKRHKAVAAINGSFFHGTTVESSVGLVMKHNEIIADSGHRRTSLGITKQGKMVMGVPQIRTGIQFADTNRFQRVNGVNQPRKTKQTIVYTPRFGKYTHTNQWGREVVVEDNRVVRYSYGNTQIPRNGFVISAHGRTGTEIQHNYPLGTYLELSAQRQGEWQDVTTVVTGAPHLVHQGRIHNTYFKEHLHSSLKRPNSRSAVGFTHNQKMLMINVFPEKGRGGVTFTRLAQIMRRLGAVEAMALDGGGSTSLYVSERGINHGPRPVTNALIVTLDQQR